MTENNHDHENENNQNGREVYHTHEVAYWTDERDFGFAVYATCPKCGLRVRVASVQEGEDQDYTHLLTKKNIISRCARQNVVNPECCFFLDDQTREDFMIEMRTSIAKIEQTISDLETAIRIVRRQPCPFEKWWVTTIYRAFGSWGMDYRATKQSHRERTDNVTEELMLSITHYRDLHTHLNDLLKKFIKQRVLTLSGDISR